MAAICTCPEDAFWPWDCIDCPDHGETADAEAQAQQQAEIDAEYAWLRAAENAGWDDDPRGF